MTWTGPGEGLSNKGGFNMYIVTIDNTKTCERLEAPFDNYEDANRAANIALFSSMWHDEIQIRVMYNGEDIFQ